MGGGMSLILNGTTGLSGVDGSSGTPALQGNDSNTGVSFGTDTVTINTGGVARVTTDASGNVGIGTSSPSTKLNVANGAIRLSSTYELGWGDNSIYLSANTSTGFMQFVTGGSERMRIDSSGNVGIGTTTPSQKLDVRRAGTAGVIANFTDGTAQSLHMTTGFGYFGFLNPNNGALTFRNSTDTGEYARIDTSGNLLVGASTGNGRLHVKTAGNTGADWGAQIVNSDGTIMFAVLNNGQFYTGNGTYNNTTASAANLVVGADNGIISRSTSSIKYKTDVNDAAHGLADLLMLRPVTYKGKNDGDTVFGGLIAEEVHKAGLTEFVQYAEDGSPDALAYGNMVSLCIKAIQEQQALITQLQADVAALKGAA
jgi:hypothetical protein